MNISIQGDNDLYPSLTTLVIVKHRSTIYLLLFYTYWRSLSFSPFNSSRFELIFWDKKKLKSLISIVRWIIIESTWLPGCRARMPPGCGWWGDVPTTSATYSLRASGTLYSWHVMIGVSTVLWWLTVFSSLSLCVWSVGYSTSRQVLSGTKHISAST